MPSFTMKSLSIEGLEIVGPMNPRYAEILSPEACRFLAGIPPGHRRHPSYQVSDADLGMDRRCSPWRPARGSRGPARQMTKRSHHDMGGEPAGEVKQTEHDYAEWERRIDAMNVLLWGQKGGRKLMTVDEHRKNIEALPPEAYDKLTYYEKWISALTQTLIQRGIITTEELGRKMEEVARRKK